MMSANFLALALAILSTAALQVVGHSHNFEGLELVNYRRSYASKHRDLSSRCGEALNRRRMRRALSMSRRSTSSRARSVAEPVDAAIYEHLVNRASSDNSSACLLTPEVTQGPYHILGELVQQDIRGGEPGIPLHILVDFVDVDSCEPLSNAWVDVWSANATGYYSGYESASSGAAGGGGGGDGGEGGSMPSANNTSSADGSSSATASVSASDSTITASATSAGGSGGGPGSMSIVSSATIDSYTAGADSSSGSSSGGGNSEPTDGDNFLRGVWQTDEDGLLTMYGIIPGWYSGRAPHVHLKVYEAEQGYRAENGSFIANDTTSHHTGQWFFPDDVMDEVATISPYSNNAIAWDSATKNADDSIYPYANSLGSSANMEITYVNASDISYGLIATTVVGINTTYTSAELTTFYWDPEQSDDDSSTSSSVSQSSSTASASTASASASSA